jgi:hypothetical protein
VNNVVISSGDTSSSGNSGSSSSDSGNESSGGSSGSGEEGDSTDAGDDDTTDTGDDDTTDTDDKECPVYEEAPIFVPPPVGSPAWDAAVEHTNYRKDVDPTFDSSGSGMPLTPRQFEWYVTGGIQNLVPGEGPAPDPTGPRKTQIKDLLVDPLGD